MKKLLLTVLSAAIIITSCGKGDDSTPTENPTATSTKVTIGGTEYATVKIGTKSWTSVNYNGAGGVNYDNSNNNNADYGKLYTLEEAKAVVLPAGWRLPTQEDLNSLIRAAGTATTNTDGSLVVDANASKKLRTLNGWTRTSGDNSLGFAAFPGGDSFLFSNPARTVFTDKGTHTYYWSSTSAANTTNGTTTVKNQYALEIVNIKYTDNTVDDYAAVFKSSYADLSRYSVRFVKDN